jgi:hypothetical protein
MEKHEHAIGGFTTPRLGTAVLVGEDTDHGYN